MDQLCKGQAWLEHTMKMLGMTPWTYVGYTAFPNIDNKKILKETGLDIMEDEFKVFNLFLMSEQFYIYIFTFLQDDSY